MKKVQKYIINSLNGMAIGLFASLIIGLILKQLGSLLHFQPLIQFGTAAQYLMGPAIGASTAYFVKAPPLVIIASTAVGAIGAGTFTGANPVAIGEPLGAFIASLAAAEAGKWIAKLRIVEIIVVPAATIVVGGAIGLIISPYISTMMNSVGAFINFATELHPIPMGMILAVVMGIILTLPISSAAIAISLGISGLAGGASLVGCCCQMVGFAVISYKDNGFGGLIAQGLGTSMLQIPNIIKNPLIWIPSIVASAILGPISTTLLRIESTSIGAGMGTSGLVGQFGAYTAMGEKMGAAEFAWKIGLMNFILPALLSFAVYYAMRKLGLIKQGDMKLEVSGK